MQSKHERQILAIGSTEEARSSMYKQGMQLTPKGCADFTEACSNAVLTSREAAFGLASEGQTPARSGRSEPPRQS